MESAPAQPQPDAPAPNPRKPIRPLWLAVWLFSGCLVLAGVLYALWPAYEKSRWLKVKAEWDNGPGLRFAKPPKPRPPDDRNVARHPLFRDCGIEGSKARERLLASKPDPPSERRRSDDAHPLGYLDLRGLEGGEGESLEDVARRLEAFFAKDATLEADFDDAMKRPECWWSGEPAPGQFQEDHQIDCMLALSARFQLRALSEGVLGHHDEALRSLLRLEPLGTRTQGDERMVPALAAVRAHQTFLETACHGFDHGWWNRQARERIEQTMGGIPDATKRSAPALRAVMLETTSFLVSSGEAGTLHGDDFGCGCGTRGLVNRFLIAIVPSKAFGYRSARVLMEGWKPVTAHEPVTGSDIGTWDCEVGDLHDGAIRPGAALNKASWSFPLRDSMARCTGMFFRFEIHRSAILLLLAAERYRDVHGTYPPDAKILAADLKADWPLDPIDGKPIRYALRPDGFPKVWSVGGDGVDDGGKPGTKPYGDDGDWIWPPETTKARR